LGRRNSPMISDVDADTLRFPLADPFIELF
jgi:hypothetical protein